MAASSKKSVKENLLASNNLHILTSQLLKENHSLFEYCYVEILRNRGRFDTNIPWRELDFSSYPAKVLESANLNFNLKNVF